MLVINSIEKSRLQADSFSYSGGGVAWKARFVLFLGFALLAGGLAGSVVCLSSLFFFCERRDLSMGLLIISTSTYADGYGSQVYHQQLSVGDALFWDC